MYSMVYPVWRRRKADEAGKQERQGKKCRANGGKCRKGASGRARRQERENARMQEIVSPRRYENGTTALLTEALLVQT